MPALLPATQAFLKKSPLKMFINGQWCDAQNGERIDVRDPGEGKVIARIPAGGAADIDSAVAAAHAAFHHSGWATMPPNDRAVMLHRLADLVDKHRDTLAQLESLDVGKPLAQAAAFDIPNVAQTLRYYADLSVQTRRREPIAVASHEAYSLRVPYGVCAFILPWNFPLLLVGWSLAPALAVGNTVVIKP